MGEIDNPDFFAMSIEDQARFLGQRDGCPVVEGLIDPDTGRGPEKMIRRYGSVNFWYGYISRAVQHLNPSLYEDFSKKIQRKENEPVGKHEPVSVPDNYSTTMAPMNSLWGYSLPRIIVEQIPNNTIGDEEESDEEKDIKLEENQQKLYGALSVLEESIKRSKTPSELMARVAGELVAGGADQDKILKHILGQGWLDEHNAYTMLEDGKSALRDFAPKIWAYYQGLTTQEKKEKSFV